MVDRAAMLGEGLKLHRAGDIAAAEQIYRRMLASDPNQADAWYLLGRTCQASGKNDEAVACHQRALTLRPDFVEAHAHLGNALGGIGQVERAIACYREALRLYPAYLEAQNNLGNALSRLGRHAEAVECFRHVIAQQPGYAEAQSNLGMVYKSMRTWDQAAAALREAIRIKPGFAEAHCNLAIVLAEAGDQDGAMSSYQRALVLKPDLSEALYGRAHLLMRQRNFDQAEAFYREAIQIRPGSAELWNGFAFVLAEQGNLAEALAGYREALRLKPAFVPAWSNYLYHLNYDPGVDAPTLLEEHRRGALALSMRAPALRVADRERAAGGALRVGYVSPDFRRHAVASFVEPILGNHDPRRIEAFCYSDVGTPDATTARLRSFAHAWRETRHLSDDELDALVRRDQIDILVDLAGHTARNRLGVFARNPAPVLITYLGYPGTTGLPTIDAIVTDKLIDPPDRPGWATEEPLRLNGPFCCFSPPEDAGDVSPLPALAAGFPTFGSLHKLPKLNHQVIDLWSALLRAIPSAAGCYWSEIA